MLYGPRAYLRRAARDTVREMNKEFGKLDKPRDTKWSSRGCGVVYEPARGLSPRQYETLELGRALTFSGEGVGESKIIRDYTPTPRKVRPARSKLTRSLSLRSL